MQNLINRAFSIQTARDTDVTPGVDMAGKALVWDTASERFVLLDIRQQVIGLMLGTTPYLSVTSFEQSYGSELLTNGDMETGSPPTGWSVVASTPTSEADERTGGAGVASLQGLSTGTGEQRLYRSFTAQSGRFAEMTGWMRNVDATDVRLTIYDAVGNTAVPFKANFYSATSWVKGGLIRRTSTSTTAQARIRVSAIGQAARVDDLSVKYITLNTQRTIPADADVRVQLTLPGTPYIGQQVMLLFRVQGTLETEYNCWVVQLMRNHDNDAWSIRLLTYTAGVAAEVWQTDDVGDPDWLRVRFYGTTVQAYTLEGSGEWIARTPQIVNSHMSTATGLNVITAEGMQVDQMDVYLTTPFDYGLANRLDGGFVVLGDSKSALDTWSPEFKNLAERRSGNLWTQLANWATGGWTVALGATNIAAQIAALSAEFPPSYALCNFGANDTGAGALATFKTNYTTIIDAIHAAYPDCKIYLMRPWVIGEDAACDTIAGYIDDLIAANPTFVFAGPDERVFLENGDNGATYMADPKHPTTAGYVLTAQQWCKVLL